VKYEYKPSFDRTFKKLDKDRQKEAKKAIFALIDFFETGERTSGLGLKQLRGDFWGIRCGLKDRIIFTFEGDMVGFLIVGSHDEIRKFLKNL
jgi:mRNA-degrading endonuclease RelE of RelBE toxin-antitoxin system